MTSRNSKKGKMAMAVIKGSKEYPKIYGRVIFKEADKGVIVTAEIEGLPYDNNENNIFAFHIHEGESCGGTGEKPFADAKGHFEKDDTIHPKHSGDMPPLFSNDGYAYMSFFTNRFSVDDVINKAVVIHKNVDDFTTDPSGNAGEMIACGKILRL